MMNYLVVLVMLLFIVSYYSNAYFSLIMYTSSFRCFMK